MKGAGGPSKEDLWKGQVYYETLNEKRANAYSTDSLSMGRAAEIGRASCRERV